MRNPKGFSQVIVIVLILLAVLLVGGGVFWVVSQQGSGNANQNQNANTAVSNVNTSNANVSNTNANTNTNTTNQNTNASLNQNTNASVNTNSDPTTNWKTYRNEKYGFEVKYPPSFNLKENESSEFEKQNTEILFTLDLRTIDEQRVVAVGVYNNLDNLPLDEWINKNTPNPNAYEEVVVDGQNSRKYSVNAMGNRVIEYVIPFTNRIYFVNSLPTTSEFSIIFNTFRFVK